VNEAGFCIWLGYGELAPEVVGRNCGMAMRLRGGFVVHNFEMLGSGVVMV
jgi:hypothetical protein